tara:strand:+ start:524 stop:862 length:339 start_codon:yes stop_codon:yes gene_type:complete
MGVSSRLYNNKFIYTSTKELQWKLVDNNTQVKHIMFDNGITTSLHNINTFNTFKELVDYINLNSLQIKTNTHLKYDNIIIQVEKELELPKDQLYYDFILILSPTDDISEDER